MGKYKSTAREEWNWEKILRKKRRKQKGMRERERAYANHDK